MARLIDVSQFHVKLDGSLINLNPFWYFPDATHYNSHVKFTIASAYPDLCAIPEDKIMDWHDLPEHGKLRMEIRRWIERNLSGDVILSLVDKTYRYIPEPSKHEPYPYPKDIRHRYYVFHFETTSDMMYFRLNFSDHVVEMSNRNPRFSYLDKLADEFEKNRRG